MQTGARKDTAVVLQATGGGTEGYEQGGRLVTPYCSQKTREGML